jgi:alkylation response protein AidB-like acyl-CoA dehydrogenase
MIAFEPTEEQELIRDTVREFAESEIRELERPADEAEEVQEEFLEKSWELGLVNSAIPESLGGGGFERSPITNTIVLEELAAGSVSLAVSAMAPSLFINPLLDFGTEEQQAEFLPLFTGASYHAASLALHEESFVFDATNLSTVAESKGEGFSLTGAKRFVPMGDRASHFLVVARSGAREGLADLEAFIVPSDAKGVSVEREKMLGLRGAPFARLDLDHVEVPKVGRLGGQSGIDGRRLVNSSRVASAALCVGLSRAVMEICIPYAKDRVAFGQPIAQKQAIAFMLAEMQIEVNAMRLLVWKAASQLEQGTDATKATQLAQAYMKRETMKIADNGLQIFGGHGYIRDYPLEMWYRNARTVTVLESAAAV